MPIYEYNCEECDHYFTRLKKIDERLIDTCPKCESSVKQVIFSSAKLPIGKMGCDPSFSTAYGKWEKMQRSKSKVGGQWDSNNERWGGHHEKK